jgi:hypothetical protein
VKSYLLKTVPYNVLIDGDKKIVAVCISRIQDDANNDYISTLNDVVSSAGYNILVYNNSFSTFNMEGEDDEIQLYVYNLNLLNVKLIIIH